MSWFFGAVGEISDADRDRFASITSKSTSLFHSSEHFLLATGSQETSSCRSMSDRLGFVICGKAISSDPESLHFLNKEEWRQLISSNQQAIRDLNGHFAGIHWTDNTYTFFTDRLGLREILLYQNNGILYFTTSEEFLPLMTGHSHEINWDAFSARWLLINQLSLTSTIENTIRLTAGTQATFENNRLTVHWATPLRPQFDESANGDLASSVLRALIELPDGQLKRHVALSAGMDSRLMLSYLLSGRKVSFESHTFEDPQHPDSLITKEMASDLGFRHDVIATALPTNDADLADTIRKYFVSKKVTTNSIHFLASLPYDQFKNMRDGILLDGGFGEIGRRRFHERIRIRNKPDLLSNDPLKIYKLLHRVRSDIFNTSLSEMLVKSAQEQIAAFLSSNPSVKEIGVDQWLDLMAVQTILPNFNGFEQARMDRIIENYCPFTQPAFIDAILACPIPLRRNARLYRTIIGRNLPQLKKYPLVKFEATYPYRFSAAGASLWTSAKQKLGLAFSSNAQVILIKRLETFVRDTAASRHVKEFAAYDSNKIQYLINNFYSGQHELASQVDWWLSFELWRQSLLTTT